jgi:ABC-2 type transport system permease protein
MRLLSVFWKTLREQSRDIWVLVLSLIFGPLFVLLYWMFFPSGSTTYGVLVLNNDITVQSANGTTLGAGSQVIEAMYGVTYADGSPLLKIGEVTDRAEAETRLRNRDASALVIIPADFSRTIQAALQGNSTVTTSVTFVGDLTNPYYAVAVVMAHAALDQYIQAATGQQRSIQVTEEPLGASAARTEFENYVPGLLVFAVVMLVFMAAMTVTREIEAETLRRLQITRMTSLDLLGGISAAIVLIGTVAVVLTFLTAVALGFRSQGPLWVAILVGAMASLSVVGTGLMVACFSETVARAFVIANFPLALFMFFSGAAFPAPRLPFFSLGDRTIALFDILPPTHAVVALNKVLTLGAGPADIVYELVALIILSVVYFAAGVWLFQRNHLTVR